VKKNSFGPLELEMVDLERFWRKTPLGPLGVKKDIHWIRVYFWCTCISCNHLDGFIWNHMEFIFVLSVLHNNNVR
jgi:hypothetical protein